MGFSGVILYVYVMWTKGKTMIIQFKGVRKFHKCLRSQIVMGNRYTGMAVWMTNIFVVSEGQVLIREE